MLIYFIMFLLVRRKLFYPILSNWTSIRYQGRISRLSKLINENFINYNASQHEHSNLSINDNTTEKKIHLTNINDMANISMKTDKKISTDFDVKRLLWNPCFNAKNSTIFNHYKRLAKHRLTTLVVITTMAGYAASPHPFNFGTFVLCSLGTGLVSAAANAINQYHEVPFDSQMSRTKSRVLVTGRITPLHAVGFATFSVATGIGLLYFNVNELATMLCGVNFLLYTSIYTPLKRISILNTWVGSVVGAIPPLIGWVGCSGSIDIGAWILCGLLYAWQFPHFNALSWTLRSDYSRAGYRMMSVTNPGLCRRTTLRYTIVIAALCYLPPIFYVTNIWFSLISTPLNAYFCYLAYQFYRYTSSRTSRPLFKFSLIHLPAIMLLFILCKKYNPDGKNIEQINSKVEEAVA